MDIFDREDGWVKNLFTGGSGFPGWIPLDPQSDEAYIPRPVQSKPVTPHTPIPKELYVPTWPTPQPPLPLPPKGK